MVLIAFRNWYLSFSSACRSTFGVTGVLGDFGGKLILASFLDGVGGGGEEVVVEAAAVLDL